MNKKYIIKKNEDIDNIIKLGKKINSKYYIIYYMENKLEFNRYVVSVSKKIGKAVTRNYIKRQLKDILTKNSLYSSKDYVIIVRKQILELSYKNKQEELLKLIKER